MPIGMLGTMCLCIFAGRAESVGCRWNQQGGHKSNLEGERINIQVSLDQPEDRGENDGPGWCFEHAELLAAFAICELGKDG